MKAGATAARPLGYASGLFLLTTIVVAQPSQTVAFSPGSALFQDSVTVQLSGAAAGQQIRYVIASGTGAVDATVTPESPVYTSPITLSSTSVIRAAVFVDNAAGRLTTGHYLKLGADLASFTSQLPVLVLDDFGAGPLERDNLNHRSWLFGLAPTAGAVSFNRAPVFSTPLVSSVRGSSSADFPKKGYNIRLRDSANRVAVLPLFDLPAYERWALVAPWAFDATFFNNNFVYELSNRIGRWAPRTRLTELFFNSAGDDLTLDDYAGIYVITDRIRAEPGRVDVDRLAPTDAAQPAITGGYVVKIDAFDVDELGWVTDHGVPVPPDTRVVLVEPSAEDITPAQLDYIQGYIQQMENALHADRAANWTQRTYLDYLDRSSWVDHHILNVLASNPDALHRSAYFTKPREGKLQAGPVWDFDRALGGLWDGRTSVVNTWSGVGGAVDVWDSGWWGILAEDPEFIQEWVDRWQSLREGELSTAALVSLAQNLADTVGVSAAQRDANRWPDSASPLGGYLDQIAYLKSWLTQRTAWIDSQFVAAPIITVEGAEVTFTPPADAMLAYTLDGSDPRAIGGGVTSSTRMDAGPLTLPIAAGARVRSYDPNASRGVPSSPWSRAVQQPRASPAVAAGRLVNLSTKSAVGAASDAMIVGFVVTAAQPKRYLVRAVGPGLRAFGEARAVGATSLTVTSSAGAVVAQSDAWAREPLAATLPAVAQSVGAFPLNAAAEDSATVASLPGGNYTIQLRSRSGESGTALAELYELDQTGSTTNLSVRARASAALPLTSGFVLGGAGSTRLLIRAVGPTLRALGVSDAASDTSFTLRSGRNFVAANDNWTSGSNASVIESANRAVGAFPLAPASMDAALVTTLPPGAYTIEVNAAGRGGTVLFELYELP